MGNSALTYHCDSYFVLTNLVVMEAKEREDKGEISRLMAQVAEARAAMATSQAESSRKRDGEHNSTT